ncbi:MAG: hypothetical protein JWN63_1037 [Candidatus Acidoferrum typicum]|nr:hypothetical protein [Candidatus Acidoferrum typicum]
MTRESHRRRNFKDKWKTNTSRQLIAIFTVLRCRRIYVNISRQIPSKRGIRVHPPRMINGRTHGVQSAMKLTCVSTNGTNRTKGLSRSDSFATLATNHIALQGHGLKFPTSTFQLLTEALVRHRLRRREEDLLGDLASALSRGGSRSGSALKQRSMPQSCGNHCGKNRSRH